MDRNCPPNHQASRAAAISVTASALGTTGDLGFLTGGGRLGALMRAHDWSASPVGPPTGWPQSLRTAITIAINSRHPMFVAWGDELTFFYNDAYAEILGAKHPAALGRRFHDIWAEIWSDILPLIQRALAGEANIPGSRIGKIEIRDSFSIVEVQSDVADQVIRAVNGTTMKGRSLRVDYDRGGPARRPPPRGGAPRRTSRRPPQ